MKLNAEIVSSFKVARVCREHEDYINAIDYSADGSHLISSGFDDRLVVYDCNLGISIDALTLETSGVNLIHFTHAKYNVLFSSTKKVNQTIRYFSLYDKKFLHDFHGHENFITSLSLSPVNDTFISTALDKTLGLWDLNSPNCMGLLHCSGNCVAAFDPKGLIFAVAINSEEIRLYDVRLVEKGPFNVFKLQKEKDFDWTGLKFSRDGKYMLIATNGTVVRMLDAYDCRPLKTFDGYENNLGEPIEANFSPDSQFVMSGSTNGLLHVWDVETGNKVVVLNGKHTQSVRCSKFNPKYMILASACKNLGFWQPITDNVDYEKEENEEKGEEEEEYVEEEEEEVEEEEVEEEEEQGEEEQEENYDDEIKD